MMEAAREELKRSVRVPLDRGWKTIKKVEKKKRKKEKNK